MQLEDKNGLPWTASTGLSWIVLMVVVTCGIGYAALSIYLALWIYTKGRSVLPLFCFSVITLAELLHIPFAHSRWLASIADAVGTISAILWIAATFHLRHEIMSHFRETEGWEIGIGPWFTFFFSAPYINYCLNPITISDGRNTITSLNLDPSPRKITE